MRLRAFGAGWALLAALGLAATPGAAAAAKPADAGTKLAWLQPKNIGRNGLRGTHTVALTFDDGPNENTTRVLNALDDYGVKATFFIVGRMAARHPDVLEDVAERGHLLGNHSATHARLGVRYQRNPRLLADQLRVVDRDIRPLMKPNETLFFRAPYGYWKASHAAVLNRDPRLKAYVGPIFWDEGGEIRFDSEGFLRSAADWDCWERGWTVEACAKGYLREIHAKDGGVVLMHAIHPKAAALVRAMLPVLQREGYTFVRLDALKEYDQYKTPPGATTPFVAFAEPEPERDDNLPARGLRR